MFQACKIKLYKDKEWIFVRLNGPLRLPVDHIESQYELFQWAAKYHTSGPFHVRQNSFTESVEPGKFVLSKTWPHAFWTYSPTDQALHFMSRSHESGGGLKYGQKELTFKPALTLHRARLTARGVEPMDRGYTGRATVQIGGNMPMLSRLGGEVLWEWRSWDWGLDQE